MAKSACCFHVVPKVKTEWTPILTGQIDFQTISQRMINSYSGVATLNVIAIILLAALDNSLVQKKKKKDPSVPKDFNTENIQKEKKK